MGLRKNILLKRSVILSMIIFSILITSGIALIFNSSFRKDSRHTIIGESAGKIQHNILKSRIIIESIIMNDSVNIPELNHSLDSIRKEYLALEELLKGKSIGSELPAKNSFEAHYKQVLNNLDFLTAQINVPDPMHYPPDTLILKAFNQFELAFKEFNSQLPQYLLITNVQFKREIVWIISFIFVIVLISGYLILRLIGQLIIADRTLMHKTIEVENRERERIAADLHDGLGSLLSGLIIHIQVLEKESENTPELREKLQHLNFLATTALQSIEEVINNLNPAILSKYGLIQTLEKMAVRINKLGKTQFRVEAKNLTIKIPRDMELSLYRICSELYNNALKHSRATKAEFIFSSHKNQVQINYSDNGIGFEYGLSAAEDQKSGLSNLVRRVESMEGICKITSKPDAGVKIEIIFEVV